MALAAVAPLLWLSVGYRLEAGMVVIDRAAVLLLHHGSPYLPAGQLISWLSYDPYRPAMTLFGLPSAAGLGAAGRLGGLPGNPGIWLAVVTVALLAAAFLIARPHRDCAESRRDATWRTALSVASLRVLHLPARPPRLAGDP